MQLVYQTSNLFDAHLVKHALEDAGIPAFVFGEHLLGGGGELPLTTEITESLREWLLNHIQGEDRELGLFLLQKRGELS